MDNTDIVKREINCKKYIFLFRFYSEIDLSNIQIGRNKNILLL